MIQQCLILVASDRQICLKELSWSWNEALMRKLKVVSWLQSMIYKQILLIIEVNNQKVWKLPNNHQSSELEYYQSSNPILILNNQSKSKSKSKYYMINLTNQEEEGQIPIQPSTIRTFSFAEELKEEKYGQQNEKNGQKNEKSQEKAEMLQQFINGISTAQFLFCEQKMSNMLILNFNDVRIVEEALADPTVNKLIRDRMSKYLKVVSSCQIDLQNKQGFQRNKSGSRNNKKIIILDDQVFVDESKSTKNVLSRYLQKNQIMNRNKQLTESRQNSQKKKQNKNLLKNSQRVFDKKQKLSRTKVKIDQKSNKSRVSQRGSLNINSSSKIINNLGTKSPSRSIVSKVRNTESRVNQQQKSKVSINIITKNTSNERAKERSVSIKSLQKKKIVSNKEKKSNIQKEIEIQGVIGITNTNIISDTVQKSTDFLKMLKMMNEG